VDRHSISRHARLTAVTLLVLLLTPMLPVAVSGFGARIAPEPPTSVAWAPARANAGEPVHALARELSEIRARAAATEAHRARVAAAQAAALEAAKARAAAAAKARAAAAAKAQATARTQERQRAAAAARAASATVRGGSYGGRNRMWYPALGISQSVSWFPCSRSRAPDNYVYRWGCAGSNNVYLMAHAWGKFNPLYRAYYSGRLARGQLLVYADNSGRVHRYRLSWWRTYPPLTSASWAWASLARSSATLQTCVGPNSSMRLFVRFVEA
jgi:hypothetical protein